MSVAYLRGERARPDWVRAHPQAWMAAVATVCFGAFMGQLDASVLSLTYHAIGAEFGAGLGAVQWVSLGYLIALGALLVPVGELSDRLGRKRLYLWGFAAFTLSSLGCALAPNLAVLVVLRVVQGVGAAMLQANSIALIATSVPADRLRRALGVQAAAQAVGLAIGPTAGGWIVDTIGWRWVFAINVPVGVVALVAGRFLLPRTRLDPSVAHSSGRLRAVLRVRTVDHGLVGALVAYLLLFGPIVLVPTILQISGTSALRAGLITAGLPVGFAAAAVAGRFVVRTEPHRRATFGLVITAAGLAGLLVAGIHPAGCVAALAAIGFGLGLYTPVNNATVMAARPRGTAAVAGGLVNIARAAGTAIGIALVATTVETLTHGRLTAVVLLAVAVLAVPLCRLRAAPDPAPVAGS